MTEATSEAVEDLERTHQSGCDLGSASFGDVPGASLQTTSVQLTTVSGISSVNGPRLDRVLNDTKNSPFSIATTKKLNLNSSKNS
jgi:hypothetical protein